MARKRFEAGVGAEYAAVGREPKALGYRVGLAGAVSLHDSEPALRGGLLFESALLVTIHKGEGSYGLSGNLSTPTWALAPVFEGAVVGPDAVGRFGVGIGIDYYSITSWTVR